MIIDDEHHAIGALSRLLENFDDLEVIGVGHGLSDANDMLKARQPDILFLDIMLGDVTGFELLSQHAEKSFKTIFTTAFSQFAINAIRAGAFDYLLKPISEEQLRETLHRLDEVEPDPAHNKQRSEVAYEFLSGNGEHIALPESHGYRVVNINEIVHIQAQGNYCDIKLASGERITITRKLKSFENMLASNGFSRVHHSHLINLKHLKKYSRLDGGTVKMSNGDEVYISKLYRENFLMAFDGFKKL